MALEEMGYVHGDAFIILYFLIYILTICSHYKLLLYGKEEQEISNFVEFFGELIFMLKDFYCL